MAERIGLGIITCNRKELFKDCISSLPEADEIIVVNDGKSYDMSYPSNITKIIHHKHNLGVGKSKNQALRYLMEKGCEHLFLMEDDVKIINKEALHAYIKTAKISGLKHLNFAYHGPANKDIHGSPAPRKVIRYTPDVAVSLHGHLAGAFSYYTRDVIEKFGYYDEIFKNAYEHVDHTMRLIEAGLYSPFFWFADVADSYNYIADLDPKLEHSVIRKNMYLFKAKYKILSYIYKRKHGFTIENTPKKSVKEVEEILNQIFIRNGSDNK